MKLHNYHFLLNNKLFSISFHTFIPPLFKMVSPAKRDAAEDDYTQALEVLSEWVERSDKILKGKTPFAPKSSLTEQSEPQECKAIVQKIVSNEPLDATSSFMDVLSDDSIEFYSPASNKLLELPSIEETMEFRSPQSANPKSPILINDLVNPKTPQSARRILFDSPDEITPPRTLSAQISPYAPLLDENAKLKEILDKKERAIVQLHADLCKEREKSRLQAKDLGKMRARDAHLLRTLSGTTKRQRDKGKSSKASDDRKHNCSNTNHTNNRAQAKPKNSLNQSLKENTQCRVNYSKDTHSSH